VHPRWSSRALGLPDSFVIETTWQVANDTVRICDCMAPGSPTPAIFRVTEGLAGDPPPTRPTKVGERK